MKVTFSIASLLIVVTVSAMAIRGWQLSRPLDHFVLDVSGSLVSKLTPDTILRVVENPDYRRSSEYEFKLSDLPVRLPEGYSRRGCIVEFWTPREAAGKKLFSVVVDRDLFDEFRVVTLKLDMPLPELNADLDSWATQRWSPNLTRRMRYLDLPWWNGKTERLEPIPKVPDLIVSKAENGKVLERCTLQHHRCDFKGYYGEIAVEKPLRLHDGDRLLFAVEYDSGGLFETIKTEETFKYSEDRHGF